MCQKKKLVINSNVVFARNTDANVYINTTKYKHNEDHNSELGRFRKKGLFTWELRVSVGAAQSGEI